MHAEQYSHKRSGRARLQLATAMVIEQLEPRQMLTVVSIDVGPQFQAPQPDWKGWSGSGNSSSTTVALSATNQPTLTVSGTALTWNDFSNAHTVTSALNLAYRDGVSRAGDITLGFANLAAGTYSLVLSSVDYGTAGSAGAPWASTFNVRLTDLTRTNITLLSARNTATRYSVASADLPSFSFAPKADGTASVVLSRTSASGSVFLNAIRLGDPVLTSDAIPPSPSTPIWQTSPYAVKAGVAAVSMVAGSVSDTSGVEYYFENVNTPSRNSGWIATSSWTDLGLAASSTQQYRFKARDKSTALNETNWSAVSSVTTASDNTYGGFSTAEVGLRRPNFDFSGIRAIPHAPAVGIHPRIFTSPEELPELRNRLATTANGQEAMAQIHAYTSALILGYNNGGTYSTSAPYAKDAYNTARLGNPGYWGTDINPYYTALVNWTPGSPDPLPYNTNGTYDSDKRKRLASSMTLVAYECWVYQGQPEYDQRAIDLAKAMDNWATLVTGNAQLNHANYNIFGGAHMAEMYDFNYNAMTPTQRDNVRGALAAIAPTINDLYGTDNVPYSTTSNWAVLNDFQPIMLLAIEGEAGYNAAAMREFMRVQYNFITYGWYDTGAPNEGMGKNYQGLATMAAFARRDYNLIGHPHVRAFATNYLPKIIQPFGNAFSEYDDWGGTGRTPSTGDYKFAAEDAVGAKWLFPNDSAVDFVLQNYMGVSGNSNPYAAYSAQNALNQVMLAPNGYVNPLVVGALQTGDFNSANLTPSNWQSANASAQKNSKFFFEPNRGLVINRSDFSQSAMQLQLSSRQDLGGHTHADRNTFTLSSLGRTWAVYRTEGSDGVPDNITQDKYHSLVFVDGIAQGINSDLTMKAPGKVVSVVDTDAASFAAADAKYAYDWLWQGSQSTYPTPGQQPVMESLNDFRLQPNTTDAWYDEPLFNRPYWDGSGKYERFVKQQPYNPMIKAYRTAGIVRGARPYSLILDDYQKDQSTHNYQWVMQLPDDLSIDSSVINQTPSNYRNDIILKPSTGNLNVRLLVRVIQNDGQVNNLGAPGAIDTVIQPRTTTGATWNRLVLTSNSVAPNFKVMLFPYTVGETLPVTTVSNGQFTNTLDGRTDTLNYSTGADGRTRYALVQAGQTVTSEATDTIPAAPSGLQADPVSHTQIDLNWNSNSTNHQVFKIQRSSDGINFTTVNTVLSSITNYSDTGLTAGVQYAYRVVAANTFDSAPSNVVTRATFPTGSVGISYTGQTYTQNFNTLFSPLVHNQQWNDDNWLAGWYISRTDAPSPNTRYDAGNETFPRIFSEGTTIEDRALGGMLPNSVSGYHTQGVVFKNTTGTPITSVNLQYAVEQWRRNGTGKVQFYYKLVPSGVNFDLGTNLGSWTSAGVADFNAVTGTAAALDGNALANTATRSTTLNVTIPDGQFLWLGWRFGSGSASNNPTMAIDDLSVTFNSSTPTSASYYYQTSPNQLRFVMAADPSFSVNSVTITPSGGGSSIPATAYNWDVATSSAVFNLPTPLPDNNYVATLTGGYSHSFFSLSGDANHDRTVDSVDFNLLLANYGGVGKTFGEGDFNYDGKVNTIDFNTLAGQFGKTLPAPAEPLATTGIAGAAPVSPTGSPFSINEIHDDIAQDVLA